MLAMFFNRDAGHAPAAFFALAGVVLAAYTALVFGALSLLKYIVRWIAVPLNLAVSTGRSSFPA